MLDPDSPMRQKIDCDTNISDGYVINSLIIAEKRVERVFGVFALFYFSCFIGVWFALEITCENANGPAIIRTGSVNTPPICIIAYFGK